jgi:hypothetical protein
MVMAGNPAKDMPNPSPRVSGARTSARRGGGEFGLPIPWSAVPD